MQGWLAWIHSKWSPFPFIGTKHAYTNSKVIFSVENRSLYVAATNYFTLTCELKPIYYQCEILIAGVKKNVGKNKDPLFNIIDSTKFR